MILYINSTSRLNIDLHDISEASINGGSKTELKSKLISILNQIPKNRYLLVFGSRGYNTGYLKLDSGKYKWLYNGEEKDEGSYWETDDNYVIMPEDFEVTKKIHFEDTLTDDDEVRVWDVTKNDTEIYSGLESEEPMAESDWIYCPDLGIYYLEEYKNREHHIYIKEILNR